MLIQSLKQHFPARFPEWMMAGMLSSWGAYVVLHPELFTDPRSTTALTTTAPNPAAAPSGNALLPWVGLT